MTRWMRGLTAVGECLLVVCLLAGPARCQSIEADEVETLEATGRPVSEDGVDADEAAQLIVEKTNAFREAEGLPEVEVDPELAKAAQYFADYMARTDRYGHQADGQRPSERASKHGYDYCLVAENIAYQYTSAGFETEGLAARFVKGWKNSLEHRENMLDPDVRETGVAVSQSDETGYWYAVQMFGLPKSASIEFRISNESETDVRYSIGKRTFELPPRYARTHMSCRPPTVRFDFPGESGETDEQVRPSSGERYSIVRVGDTLQVRQTK